MYGTVANGPRKARGRKEAPPLRMTPARWLALAIGVPVSLALVGWTGLNFVALAAEAHFPVSHAIPVSARHVSVNFSSGNVVLRETAAAGQGRLTGTATYSLIRPDFTTRVTADGADFSYPCHLPVGNCSLNATVTLPRGTAASVSTGGGDATATGTTGVLTLRTGGGNESVDHASGDLYLNSLGGDISATAITAPAVTASTGGGNVTVVFTQVPRNVKVNTLGGDITIEVPRGPASYKVTTHTLGGDVSDNTIPIDPQSGNVITATTGGGNITIAQS